jgi:hypothetical protein
MRRAYISFGPYSSSPAGVFLANGLRRPYSSISWKFSLYVLRLLAAWSATLGSYHGYWSDWVLADLSADPRVCSHQHFRSACLANEPELDCRYHRFAGRKRHRRTGHFFEPFYLLSGSFFLEGLRSILEDAGALADSLDPSDRSRPGPRAATSPRLDDPHAEAAVHVQAAVEQTYEPQNVLAAGSQRVSGGLRLVGPMLILTSIVLLSGVPGSLVASIAPQNQIVMWFAVLVPLLGLGTMVEGIITYQRWRRSDREFREKILR